jgi:mRNA-degrading endonuclease RelE of RelBE toxin-antitoxin system
MSATTDGVRFCKRVHLDDVAAGDRGRVQERIYRLPAAMRGEFHNLDVKPIEGSRWKGLWRLRVGDYRVLYLADGDRIAVVEIDRRDDHTYGRLDRVALVRRGGGVELIDVAEPAPEVEERPMAAPSRPAARLERTNPLTVFGAAELAAVGLASDTVALVRTLAEGIDVAAVLAERGLDPGLVQLVADMWRDPQRYVAIFAEGRTPTVEDAAISGDELISRLADDDSAAAVAFLTEWEFEGMLDQPSMSRQGKQTPVHVAQALLVADAPASTLPHRPHRLWREERDRWREPDGGPHRRDRVQPDT